MSFLWDSNILRHYLDDHPLLLENLKKVPRSDVMLPVVVVAEQFRGRMIAAQAIAGHHILVTRNTADFRDLIPVKQLQNWIDKKIS